MDIGTTRPAVNLDVSRIRHTGLLIDASDRRLKSSIRQLPTSLEAMLRLNPVSFTMNDNPGQTKYGFIAQEVLSVLPELVVTANDPSKTLGLNYPGFIAPIVKAMQELSRQLADERQAREVREVVFSQEIGVLKVANDNLRRELNELREEVRGLKRAGARR